MADKCAWHGHFVAIYVLAAYNASASYVLANIKDGRCLCQDNLSLYLYEGRPWKTAPLRYLATHAVVLSLMS